MPVVFREPRIFFAEHDADHAATLLGSPSENSSTQRIAFVTQNSGGQKNQWSGERFQQVIASLTRKFDATPVFVGTAAEAPAIEALRQSLPNQGISVAGKTTVAQLAAVLAQCDLAVSLDTGAFHVARAVGLPGVVLAPAWQDSREWLPVGHPQYRILQGPSIPVPEAAYWMEEISGEQVIAAAMELMENFPASIDSRRSRVQRGIATGKHA